MRVSAERERNLRYRVFSEARTRNFPACRLDFAGDGYVTSWANEVGWFDTLSDLEEGELQMIWTWFAKQDVPLVQKNFPHPVFLLLQVDLQRAAEHWCAARETLPQPERFDELVLAGAVVAVKHVLTEHTEALASWWRGQYQRVKQRQWRPQEAGMAAASAAVLDADPAGTGA